MAANKLQWKRIAKGDKLPCQSFLRKKNGEILKLSTGAGVTVGQDAYYLPVDDVINVIKDYPIEESEDEKMIKYFKDLAPFDKAEELYEKYGFSHKDAIAWLEKKCEQKHQYNSRPRYVGEEELLGTNKQGECPFLKQELIDMGFAFTQDGDLAYPIHKIEKKEFAAWSEEDEAVLDALIRRLEGEDVYVSPHLAAECLKSLKDRVQPKREWNEEDENIYNAILDTIYNNLGLCSIHREWFKNIKERLKFLRLQSNWKPSDGHYELEEFAKIVRCNLTGISKAVQKLFEAKYLQLTGNKMYGGFKD